jgi:hypothetical protein
MDDRADYLEDEQDDAEVYLYITWKQDWIEIADEYSNRLNSSKD